MDDKLMNLQVSQEELIFLMRALDLPDLPGIGEKPWGNIELETAQGAFQTAGRALLARKFISINGDQNISVEESIKNTLSTCAYPDQLAAFRVENGTDPAQQIFYYRSAKNFIRHSVDEYQIHLFESSKKTDMGLVDLESLISTSKWRFTSTLIEVNQEIFEKAMEAAHGEKEDCIKILSNSNLKTDKIHPLADVMINTGTRIYLQLIYKLNPKIEQNTISFMWNSDSCWFIEYPTQAGNTNLRIRAIDYQQFKKIIKAAFIHFK